MVVIASIAFFEGELISEDFIEWPLAWGSLLLVERCWSPSPREEREGDEAIVRMADLMDDQTYVFNAGFLSIQTVDTRCGRSIFGEAVVGGKFERNQHLVFIKTQTHLLRPREQAFNPIPASWRP
jgi:hypothetical protein